MTQGGTQARPFAPPCCGSVLPRFVEDKCLIGGLSGSRRSEGSVSWLPSTTLPVRASRAQVVVPIDEAELVQGPRLMRFVTELLRELRLAIVLGACHVRVVEPSAFKVSSLQLCSL